MKKFIIFNFLTISFMVFSLTVSMGQNPSVKINYHQTGIAPGSNISIPIVFDGIKVGSSRLLIRYDRDILTFNSFTSLLPALNVNGTLSMNNGYTIAAGYENSGEVVLLVALLYMGGSPGFDYSNDTIAKMNFTFNGGETNLSFINIYAGGLSNNYMTFLQANPFNIMNTSTVFTPPGSASGPYAQLNSVSGGGDWKTVSTWVENKIPTRAYDVNITGGTVTDTSKTGRCHNLTINAAGKLTVSATKSLAVAGNMLIKSDAANTGSFIDLGSTTVAGTTSVERYMTGNWVGWPPTSITWHYVASPVSGGTINSFAGALLNYWKEDTLATGYWVPMILPLERPLVVNKGYSAATTSNGVINYTGGHLNTGNQTITGLTNTTSSDARGFNLIGNSFPSAIKWDGAIARTNVDAAAYLWNGTNYRSYMADASEPRIPAEQGFYVHVTTGHATGSLVIPNTNRVHSDSTYLKSSANEQLDLKVSGNNMEDVTSIRFNVAATEGFDSEYDAYKLWGITTCPQIYSIAPNVDLSINSMPEMTTQTVIPVGFKVGINETYRITASGLETFPFGTDIYLEDILLNNTQNLNSNPIYEFTAAPGSAAHRFDLHFSPVSGLAEGTTGNVKIYAAESSVYVNVPMELHGEIIVYDLLGKEVKRGQVESNTLNKINLNVDPGYYLVKVFGDKLTVSGKVFIR